MKIIAVIDMTEFRLSSQLSLGECASREEELSELSSGNLNYCADVKTVKVKFKCTEKKFCHCYLESELWLSRK